jgi:hypothetical protein
MCKRFMIYLYTKFHMSDCQASLLVAIKPKAEENVPTAVMLLLKQTLPPPEAINSPAQVEIHNTYGQIYIRLLYRKCRHHNLT